MFASNFPVDSLCATFDEIYNGFKNITAGLPENEIQCLFHDNAIKYYNPVETLEPTEVRLPIIQNCLTSHQVIYANKTSAS